MRGRWGVTSPAALSRERRPVGTDLTLRTAASAPGRTRGLAARAFTSALATDGTVHCWGVNASGELGTGRDTGPESCDGVACSRTPIQVGFGHEPVTLATGVRRVCAAAVSLGIHC